MYHFRSDRFEINKTFCECNNFLKTRNINEIAYSIHSKQVKFMNNDRKIQFISNKIGEMEGKSIINSYIYI